MAEFATPSAATMATGDAPVTPPAVAGAEKKKPEKPDEDKFKEELKKAQQEHADAQARFNEVKLKLDSTGSKAKDSPLAIKRTELIAQLNNIRKQQGAGKTGRNQVMEQIKKLDEKKKSMDAELKTARSRLAFKSADDLDKEVARLDKQVENGTMKLVDERKALDEISKLKKQRKQFAALEESQKAIDDVKAKIKELRDSLDDPEAKALNDKYNELQAQLDVIKAEQDEIYSNLSSLREERTKLYDEQQVTYTAIKAIQDSYYQRKKAFQNYEWEARQKARERKLAEAEKKNNEFKMTRAKAVLEEATVPAYIDEISRADRLLRYLDPTYASSTPVAPARGLFTATVQRTVDATGLKGTPIVKKDEEDYFKGTGGKKGKKNRNKENNKVAAAKFNCPPSVIEDCASMSIEPPMSAADVPAVIEKVKAKLDHWKADQKAQTEKNIAKAKKEIERLDAGDLSTSIPTTNGHAKTEEKGAIATEVDLIKGTVAEVVADLNGAPIDEKAEE